MNILTAAFFFVLGGATVVALGVLGVRSFFDDIRTFLQALLG